MTRDQEEERIESGKKPLRATSLDGGEGGGEEGGGGAKSGLTRIKTKSQQNPDMEGAGPSGSERTASLVVFYLECNGVELESFGLDDLLHHLASRGRTAERSKT